MEEVGCRNKGFASNCEVYCDQYISGHVFYLHLPFFALSADHWVRADASNRMTTWQLVSPLSDRALAGPGPELTGVGVRRHGQPLAPAAPFLSASGRGGEASRTFSS